MEEMKLVKPWVKEKFAKFGAVRCEADGFKFDSKMEMEFYLWSQAAGLFGGENPYHKIEVHPKRVTLFPGLTWNLDFRLQDGTYIDVKGAEMRDFKIKKLVWSLIGPSNLVIVKRAPGMTIPWSFDIIKSQGWKLTPPNP